MLEPLKVACEGGDWLAAKVTYDDLAKGWGFRTGGDRLAAILFEDVEAIMNQIPHYYRLQATIKARLKAQHLKPTYWLACYNRETGKVLGLARMDSHDPTSIKRLLPIDTLYESALIEMANDGSFKWIGGPYSVLDP
jgi:hypothetical protein